MTHTNKFLNKNHNFSAVVANKLPNFTNVNKLHACAPALFHVCPKKTMHTTLALLDLEKTLYEFYYLKQKLFCLVLLECHFVDRILMINNMTKYKLICCMAIKFGKKLGMKSSFHSFCKRFFQVYFETISKSINLATLKIIITIIIIIHMFASFNFKEESKDWTRFNCKNAIHKIANATFDQVIKFR